MKNYQLQFQTKKGGSITEIDIEAQTMPESLEQLLRFFPKAISVKITEIEMPK